MGGYLHQVALVLGTVRSNRGLRRVELAFVGFNVSELAVWIAMLVYAYDRGGATASGLVALAQLVPAALFGPYAGALADRHRREAVLAAGYLAQGAGMAATAAALLAGGPPGVVYACAAFASTAVAVTRPAQGALLPELARTREELTAANVMSGWIESSCLLASPALTGVLLGVSGPGAVFAVMAAVGFASAIAVWPWSLDARRSARAVRRAGGDRGGDGGVRLAVATVVSDPSARLLVALLAAQFVAIGALDVLYVVLALDTLHLSASWAGYLNAAFGLGGAVGVGATVALVGRRRLMPPLVAGILAWALSLALLAVAPAVATALVLLATAGLARTVVDVAGRTLLQRAAPPDVLSRTFGLLEGLTMAALAVGALIAPLLVAVGGAPAALAGLAAILPVVAGLSVRGLLQVDQRAANPVVELCLLRQVPMLADLPAATLHGLAGSLRHQMLAPGDVLIRRGDVGDRFYAVADGVLDVEVDGRVVYHMRRGDGVGEIALLRPVPRTADVIARTAAHVFSLEREPFVAALGGHPRAQALVEQRLAASPAALVLQETG